MVVLLLLTLDSLAMSMLKRLQCWTSFGNKVLQLYFQFSEHLRDTGGRKDLHLDFYLFLGLDQLSLNLATRSFSYFIYLKDDFIGLK